MNDNIEMILENLIENNKKYFKEGTVPSYIPALSKSVPDDVGIAVLDLQGNMYKVGDYNKEFTIQSISKVLTLALALKDNGEEYVFRKVGMEPSGDHFDSIIKLETSKLRKPSNPMINAGAIATTSMIKGQNKTEKYNRILQFIRLLSRNDSIVMDEEVYKSEKDTGNKNRALAYYLKSLNIIEDDVEEVIDLYFRQCSILVNCIDLANIASVLANDGIRPYNNEELISKEICKIVKAIMLTCGMYDGSGRFAVEVGIPAKSGVGGGIMAAVPNRMGIGVYGSSLDRNGNSIVGVKILKALSKKLNLSIF